MDSMVIESYLGPTTLYCSDGFDCSFSKGCQVKETGWDHWIELDGYGAINENVTFDMEANCTANCTGCTEPYEMDSMDNASSQAIGGPGTLVTHESFLGPTTLYCPNDFECSFNEGCLISLYERWYGMFTYSSTNTTFRIDANCTAKCTGGCTDPYEVDSTAKEEVGEPSSMVERDDAGRRLRISELYSMVREKADDDLVIDSDIDRYFNGHNDRHLRGSN
jgi:hypothetical protein